MSALKTTYGSLNGQPKRPKLCKPFTDDIIINIVSRLSLRDQLVVREANKQLNKCVDQVLAARQSLTFFDTYGQSLDVFDGKPSLDGVNVQLIGRQLNGHNQYLRPLFAKCHQLRRITLTNNITITNQMIEFMANECPLLDSLALVDYRCHYDTFDWNRLGDVLANRLVSLEIECRLRQQIWGPDLVQLVAKLVKMRHLKLVCPRRYLEQVLAALGPDIRSLHISYSMGLDLRETMALINGNGRRLQELTIDYEPIHSYPSKRDQTDIFELICEHLVDLRRFAFNSRLLDTKAMRFLGNLSQMQHLSVNFAGYVQQLIIRNADDIIYDYKPLVFLGFARIMPQVISLDMNHVFMDTINVAVMMTAFPNVRQLAINIHVRCNCLGICRQYCFQCNHDFMGQLAHWSPLRSLHLSNPDICRYFKLLPLLKQVHWLRLNVSKVRDKKSLSELLATLQVMANSRPKRVLSVRLDGNTFGQILISKRMPINLRLSFDYK